MTLRSPFIPHIAPDPAAQQTFSSNRAKQRVALGNCTAIIVGYAGSKCQKTPWTKELPGPKRYTRFADEPWIEEQDRMSRQHASLVEEFNRPKRELCCLLDDKVFVAESLDYVASKVIGTRIRITTPKLEMIEGLTMSEKIRAHRSLYLKGKNLHRDISENNIIITDPTIANGYSGMLIDLDLAKELGSGPTGARHQTDTMEFMAIEVLLNIDHTYRHDLESFFYVLIWQCALSGWNRCGGSKEKPNKSRLKKWYTGSYEEIADVKTGHMDANRFEDLLQEFPPEFDQGKSLCRELRGILFPYRNGLVIGTPVKPEKLYDPITQAFDKAIECL